MKNILSKIAGIITIFAMSFSPVLATNNNNQQVTFCHVPPGNDGNPQTITTSYNAWQNGHSNHELDYMGACQGDDDNGDDDEDSCEEVSMDYKSSTSTQVDSHDAVLVTQPVNGGWTAFIAGADWIWSEADVLDATVDITKEFTQTFTFEDAPSDVVLDIAADNSYVVKVNGVQVGEDAGEFNYRADGQDQITIPASAFVIGSNTVTFIVKNWGLTDSTPQTNPAGLMYKFTVNDCAGDEDDEDNCEENEGITEDEDCNQEPTVCTSNVNLVTNGGFEAPDVSTGTWSIFDDGTANLGWDVQWNGAFVGAPATAKLEIHDNLWTPVVEGAQYAELDADWGINDGEQASVVIAQDIPTVVGNSYTLGYDFSPRPGTGSADNMLAVWVNGSNVQNQVADGSANSGNAWTHYTYNFVATGATTAIAFKDMGTPNSLGTLLDNVSVNCTGGGEPQVCTQGAPLYARIHLNTSDATKWRNWNGGNLNAATPFFVGGTNPLPHGLGGNVYMGSEWFPLTNADGSFITDTNNLDSTVNSNVPGVAVQRINGAIRVVLYGNHSNASGGKELAAGSIELSTNASARLLGAWDKPNGFYDPISNDPYTGTRLHDVTVNDAVNPMDSRGTFKAYINQYDPRFDNVGVNSDLFQFHLVATSGTDGFYARYNYDDMIEVPCDEVVIPQ